MAYVNRDSRAESSANEDFDFIVIGSGFGGSVSAMRLAEKGYRVCVLERGKRFHAQDFPKTNWDLRRYLWLPALRCFGIQNMTLFKNVLILSGTGVGGGSLVYANTLFQPGDGFFKATIWKDLADWKAELEPHYALARRMLGVATNPNLTFVDETLRECARDLGREGTFRPSEVAVYFGEPGKTVPDPYFGGQGPERTGCISCGGCMVGCRYGAKNTLDKNYLHFAERFGARIIPETRVTNLKPLGGCGEQGWEVHVQSSTAWFRKDRRVLRAKQVVISGGVLGTLDLLLKCKHETRTLERLSPRLGYEIRTNSEALVGVTETGSKKRVEAHERDYSRGIAITSIFHPDDHTHIEPVRYPKGSSFMRLLAVPMVDGGSALLRPLRLALTLFTHPLEVLKLALHRRWAETTVILLVMQTLDNKMRITLGRNLFTLFRRKMTTAPDAGSSMEVPSFIPIGHQVARNFAKKVGGVPQSAVNEVVLNIPTTAHILGGCPIGSDSDHGVVDINHRVFNYEGLYVCDGSVIPANLGVNPSLTITAMTERAMSRIPARGPV